MIDKSEIFVRKLFREELPAWAVYHTIQHTEETVHMAREIGLYYKLNREDAEVLSIAGWFHDTGYIYGSADHEEKSIEIAKEFLLGQRYPENLIDRIENYILATKIFSPPSTLPESILKDADLSSLGRNDYLWTNDQLKKEIELRKKIVIDELEWLVRSENFLSKHFFYTEYAKQKFNQQLELNLSELRKKIQEIRSL